MAQECLARCEEARSACITACGAVPEKRMVKFTITTNAPSSIPIYWCEHIRAPGMEYECWKLPITMNVPIGSGYDTAVALDANGRCILASRGGLETTFSKRFAVNITDTGCGAPLGKYEGVFAMSEATKSASVSLSIYPSAPSTMKVTARSDIPLWIWDEDGIARIPCTRNNAMKYGMGFGISVDPGGEDNRTTIVTPHIDDLLPHTVPFDFTLSHSETPANLRGRYAGTVEVNGGLGTVNVILTITPVVAAPKVVGYEPVAPKVVGYEPVAPKVVGYGPVAPKVVGYGPVAPKVVVLGYPTTVQRVLLI